MCSEARTGSTDHEQQNYSDACPAEQVTQAKINRWLGPRDWRPGHEQGGRWPARRFRQHSSVSIACAYGAIASGARQSKATLHRPQLGHAPVQPGIRAKAPRWRHDKTRTAEAQTASNLDESKSLHIAPPNEHWPVNFGRPWIGASFEKLVQR